MVHPYLRRRAGKEKIAYAHPSLEPILKKTLGIPLFQEQVMQIAVVAAGFTPGESDELRRVVSSAWKKRQVMEGLRQRVINGMLANNISREYAEQIYKTIQGFASYGFPESHAASFALITYVSCYLKRHYPDVFTCALLNSQPMGFYSPRQLVADAQRHGVEFLPLDVQRSDWDYILEPAAASAASTLPAKLTPARHKHGAVCTHAVRMGLRSVHGLREEHVRVLVEERVARGPFRDLSDLVRRTRLPRATLIRLAAADALASLPNGSARTALWSLQSMSFDERGLFFGQSLGLDPERDEMESALLPVENSWETVRREYQTKGLSIDKHPMGVLRAQLADSPRRYVTAHQLEKLRDRTPIRIAGLMSLLQKPPTAKGMCFVSMEDETGLINIVITPDVYQTCRLLLQQRPLLDVEGRLESRDGVRNVRALKVNALTGV
jgi:DNA polymerase-3 subunit alpha/error-prone DNA polymerase